MSTTAKTYPSDLASYSNLFQRMLDCVFLLHFETFQIQDANSVAERVLGTDRDRLIGQELTQWVVPEEHEVLQQSLRSTRRKYYPRTQQTWWTLQDGTRKLMRLVLCQLTLSDGSGRELIQVIAQDITDEYEARRKAEQYLSTLQALATTDEMTRLPNYRNFKDRLESEHARSARYRAGYSIVFMDIDNFKAYNDRNGHPAGDALLALVGELLRRGCRGIDLPARYGGEEFVVLCPETPVDGAMILGERLRRMVETTDFPNGEAQPCGRVTLSVGVAGFPENGRTAEEVLKSADEAVYQAKGAGKNRVVRSTRLVNPAASEPPGSE